MELNKSVNEGKRYAPHKKFVGSMVPNWIMRRTDISQGSKLCFGRLLQYAGKNEHAFPGHEALAKELGVSIPAVKGYLRELSKLGVIEPQRMGSGYYNRYFFLNKPGVVEFRTDGHKTIHHSKNLMDTKPHADRHNSIRPINEEENQEEENHCVSSIRAVPRVPL
jgi:hypothetical protein